jgi:protein SCO1/2
MSRRVTIIALTGVCLLGALAGGAAWRRSRQAHAVPVYWDLPDFHLRGHDGRTIGNAELRGGSWIADFIFTRCSGACPAMTARLSHLQGRIPSGTRLVSITVDPEHDTAEVLAGYARAVGAGPDWLFLTGPREELYGLAVSGFKLEAMEVPPDRRQPGDDGPFLHSSKLALVDARGRVRGYYDSTDDAALSRLLADVAEVAEHP